MADAEILQERAAKKAEELAKAERESAEAKRKVDAEKKQKKPRSRRQSPTEAAVKSFLRSASTTLGREIMRGILGVIKKS